MSCNLFRTGRPCQRDRGGFAGSYGQSVGARVDVRRPERDALGDLRDHLAVVRLALLEGELEADLVVLRPALGEGGEERLGMDAAPGVEGGGEGAVAALV